MRIIKFRGKTIYGKWIYGDSIKHTDNVDAGAKIAVSVYIGSKIPDAKKVGAMKWIPVEDFTVGQFTGILDRNGKDIYEGDIIKVIRRYRVSRKNGKLRRRISKKPKEQIGTVGWAQCGLRFRTNGTPGAQWVYLLLEQSMYIEILGNIHDNINLLKPETKPTTAIAVTPTDIQAYITSESTVAEPSDKLNKQT